MPSFPRLAAVLAGAALATVAGGAFAEPILWPSLGGREGEIDMNMTFVGLFGKVEPSERPATWQTANTKLITGGAGYSIGKLGPFYDCYARLEGGYFVARAEAVESSTDDLPQGYAFYPQDRGGFVRGIIATNLVHKPRFTFGLFLQGTVPLKVDLAKFASVHLNWVGGGTNVDVALTDPAELIHLRYQARFFVGSGAYDEQAQHNAQVQLSNLFRLEATRWLLPWRIGVGFGPHFEGDINRHVNPAYRAAYGAVSPDLVAGSAVRSLSFALAVAPYFHITRHVAVELGYQHTLFGTYLQSTQQWTGGLRTAF